MSGQESNSESSQFSYQGIFSLGTWQWLGAALLEYFRESEDFMKLIGVSVAISGLFLNIDSSDIHLRRIEALFLLTSGGLISWFIIKSLIRLYIGNRTDLYYAVVLIPDYLGGLLIINLWQFLVTNYSMELLYYLKYLGIPFIVVAINLALIAAIKILYRWQKIEGKQLEWFFLLTLNFHIITAYIFSGYDFLATTDKLLSFDLRNLNILYFFFVVLALEFNSKEFKSGTRIITESVATLVLFALPWIVYSYLPPLIIGP